MGNVKRIKTGISGLDKLIEGGIPVGFNTLVIGGPGTGKTIFGLQYIYYGAISGENGVYVSLESDINELKDQAIEFGWNLEELEKLGKIILLKIPLNKKDFDIFNTIENAVKKINAKRLVFDSLITFSVNFDQFKIPLDYKINTDLKSMIGDDAMIFYKGKSRQRTVYLLIDKLHSLGLTNLIITASEESQSKLTVDGVSEYVGDGLIRLHSVEGEEQFNTLNIIKMRLTNVNKGIYNFTFSKNGITINK